MRTKTIVPEGFDRDMLLSMEHEAEELQKKELDAVLARIIRAYRRGERSVLTTWKFAGVAPALRDKGFTVAEHDGGWLIKF